MTHRWNDNADDSDLRILYTIVFPNLLRKLILLYSLSHRAVKHLLLYECSTLNYPLCLITREGSWEVGKCGIPITIWSSAFLPETTNKRLPFAVSAFLPEATNKRWPFAIDRLGWWPRLWMWEQLINSFWLAKIFHVGLMHRHFSVDISANWDFDQVLFFNPMVSTKRENVDCRSNWCPKYNHVFNDV